MSRFAQVPEALKSIPNWIIWKCEKRNGKKTKVPYDAKSPDQFAKSNDSNTWTTFENATAAVNGRFDGIGFMLHGTNLVGIDFDGVVDDGVPEPYILNIISQLGNPYYEITPSGTGLRVFVECAALPLGNRKFNAKKKGLDKYGAEIYSGHEGGRYLTVTGDKVDGEGIPKISDLSIPYFLISKFGDEHFRRLWMGDASEYENDDSRVDLALLGVLARAFNGDSAKMEHYFNASIPGHREKWLQRADYRERTLKTASNGISLSEKSFEKLVNKARKIIEFHTDPTPEGSAFDYIVGPAAGQFDGWFPLGSPSLIGGSSGSGKTTFMLDLCVKQKEKEVVFIHKTYGRPYLVLMLDRGKASHERTMKRLDFKPEQVPIRFLKACVDGDASQQIIDHIEKASPTPQLVFIEGMDMLVSDPNALEVVMPFMHEMQQIAEHFHCAIVGSVGAPKMKPKDTYTAKRDTIFGSAVWSRMSETIVTIQYDNGDDTADKRIISVLPRNARAERFEACFVGGRLVITKSPSAPAKKDAANPIRARIEEAIIQILTPRGILKASEVIDHLKELYGFTSKNTIEEVSVEMRDRGILDKRKAPGGKWVWELLREKKFSSDYVRGVVDDDEKITSTTTTPTQRGDEEIFDVEFEED